jgi:hypothetical protein
MIDGNKTNWHCLGGLSRTDDVDQLTRSGHVDCICSYDLVPDRPLVFVERLHDQKSNTFQAL